LLQYPPAAMSRNLLTYNIPPLNFMELARETAVIPHRVRVGGGANYYGAGGPRRGGFFCPQATAQLDTLHFMVLVSRVPKFLQMFRCSVFVGGISRGFISGPK
jgi:hypothetical protein